jgi:hypothetical protein
MYSQAVSNAIAKTALAMVFKLVEGAQNTRRRVYGQNQLPRARRASLRVWSPSAAGPTGTPPPKDRWG